jgi:hypothetical protein
VLVVNKTSTLRHGRAMQATITNRWACVIAGHACRRTLLDLRCCRRGADAIPDERRLLGARDTFKPGWRPILHELFVLLA